MSSIAAVVLPAVAPPESSRRRDAEREACAMAGAAPERADEPASARAAASGPVAAVAAAARTLAGERALLASDGDVLLAADAALVRRDELRRAIEAAGIRVAAPPDDAALLLAAYRAWGVEMVARVEGDVAALIWDGPRRTLLAWRDFVGRRPLHWMALSDGLLVGSTPGVIVAHPRAPREPDPTAIAAAAGALLEHPFETAWRGVNVLPPGHRLVWRVDATPVVERVWEPPVFERDNGVPFEEAREELRRLLREAVAERMDPSRPSAIWLSGGWDSPAVYGAARASGRGAVIPVSMSYPEGDRGREDELIETIVGFHGDQVRWARAADTRLIADDPRLEGGDEPFVHPYRWWNRTLAEVSRAAGATVALDGAGGDQLFAVSPVFLADLLRRGRLLAARREAREYGAIGGDARRRLIGWWQWGVRPLLAPGALAFVGALRGGRRPLGHLERPVPPWLATDPQRRDALRRRAWGWRPAGGESLGSAESRWFLGSPWAGRILAAQASAALAEGVVLRSPLLDGRIVALAATRPREERRGGGETKRLLRAAVSGWLPDGILAPRDSRSGLSTDYFRRELRLGLPRLLAVAGDARALAKLGVVEPGLLRRSAEAWLAGRASDEVALALLCTLRAELWARGIVGHRPRPSSPVTFTAGPASSP